MTIYSCETCHKEFYRRCHLTQHQNRKTPCGPEDRFSCEGCHASFSHQSSLSRHRKTCKGPQITITDLQRQLHEMQARLDDLPATSHHVTNNIDNSVNNVTHVDNSINITLNNYGNESQEHLESLSYADLKKILKLTPDHESLTRMISFIHLTVGPMKNGTGNIYNLMCK